LFLQFKKVIFMSKVVVLTNAIGGLWVFRAELMEQLVKDGKEVSIYAPEGDRFRDFEELGCRVTVTKNLNRRGSNPLQDLKLLKEYLQVLKKEKPDVVLTYTIKPNIWGGLACRLKRIPYISNVTGLGTAIAGKGLMARFCMTLYRIATRKISCLFFQNSSDMKLFSERRVALGKHRLIPGSGVNLEGHSLKPYPAEDSKFNFLFVGRVMKNKGIEEFLYAAEKLRQKYDNVSFGVCGRCEEEKYLQMLDEFSQKYDLSYYGRVRNIDDYYEACGCVVLPSYHEGTANVLLEGQANGRPVISTNAPGCGETFEDGVSGFMCNVKDREGLFEAMEKMLTLPYEKRVEMGLAARENVAKNYDRKIVISAYLEELDKILNK